MTEIIHTNVTASITELKANPNAIMDEAGGLPVAILNRNKPSFYCVPADVYEQMMDAFDDLVLIDAVKNRSGEKEIHVEIDEL